MPCAVWVASIVSSTSVPRPTLFAPRSSLLTSFDSLSRKSHRTLLASSAASSGLDLVALSNICVDIVLPVKDLPPLDVESRKKLLAEKSASLAATGDRSNWEVGGSCNVAIAAARLGLRVATCGNIASDVYGHFLRKTLEVGTSY